VDQARQAAHRAFRDARSSADCKSLEVIAAVISHESGGIDVRVGRYRRARSREPLSGRRVRRPEDPTHSGHGTSARAGSTPLRLAASADAAISSPFLCISRRLRSTSLDFRVVLGETPSARLRLHTPEREFKPKALRLRSRTPLCGNPARSFRPSCARFDTPERDTSNREMRPVQAIPHR
jgi:hypothetical protein